MNSRSTSFIFNGGYGDQYAKDAGTKYEELYPDADVKVSSTVNIQPDLQPRFIGVTRRISSTTPVRSR